MEFGQKESPNVDSQKTAAALNALFSSANFSFHFLKILKVAPIKRVPFIKEAVWPFFSYSGAKINWLLMLAQNGFCLRNSSLDSFGKIQETLTGVKVYWKVLLSFWASRKGSQIAYKITVVLQSFYIHMNEKDGRGLRPADAEDYAGQDGTVVCQILVLERDFGNLNSNKNEI